MIGAIARPDALGNLYNMIVVLLPDNLVQSSQTLVKPLGHFKTKILETYL